MLQDVNILFGSEARDLALRSRAVLAVACVETLYRALRGGDAADPHPLALLADIVASALALVACDPWDGRDEALVGYSRARQLATQLRSSEVETGLARDVLIKLKEPLVAVAALTERENNNLWLRPEVSVESRRILLRGLLAAFRPALDPRRTEDLIRAFDTAGLPVAAWDAHRLLCLSTFT
jgi:hypothetical protein